MTIFRDMSARDLEAWQRLAPDEALKAALEEIDRLRELRNDVADLLHTTEPWILSEREQKIMEILDGAAHMTDLRRNGFMRLGIVPWIGETVAFLGKCQRYPGHVKARRPKPGIECNSMESVMLAPRFLDYAKSLTPVASEYFGCPAHLWSLNAFYTSPEAAFARGLHGLHSDMNTGTAGEKLLALFVLGLDTDITGAQLHLRPDGLIEPIYGLAGTAWLADQSHMHCGLIPEKPRLLLWARWAEKIPAAFYDENLPVIP